MFAINIPEMVAAIQAKTPDSLSIRSLLYYLVPNAEFGYPEDSSGEFETQAEYEALAWLDIRPKPSWSALLAQRTIVYENELNMDLDQLRQMRFQESSVESNGYVFRVNPLNIAMIDSQIQLARKYEFSVVALITADKKVVNFTPAVAELILDELRMCLNRWIVNPLAE